MGLIKSMLQVLGITPSKEWLEFQETMKDLRHTNALIAEALNNLDIKLRQYKKED